MPTHIKASWDRALHLTRKKRKKASEAANIGSELYTTNVEVFNYAVYFTMKGDALDELNRSTELVRSAGAQCRGVLALSSAITSKRAFSSAACLVWVSMLPAAAKLPEHLQCAIHSPSSTPNSARKTVTGWASPKKRWNRFS